MKSGLIFLATKAATKNVHNSYLAAGVNIFTIFSQIIRSGFVQEWNFGEIQLLKYDSKSKWLLIKFSLA